MLAYNSLQEVDDKTKLDAAYQPNNLEEVKIGVPNLLIVDTVDTKSFMQTYLSSGIHTDTVDAKGCLNTYLFNKYECTNDYTTQYDTRPVIIACHTKAYFTSELSLTQSGKAAQIFKGKASRSIKSAKQSAAMLAYYSVQETDDKAKYGESRLFDIDYLRYEAIKTIDIKGALRTYLAKNYGEYPQLRFETDFFQTTVLNFNVLKVTFSFLFITDLCV